MNDLVFRLIASFLSGCLLSLSGSLIQTVTVNDLAGPSTLGFEAIVVVIMLFSHFLTVLGWVNVPNEILSMGIFIFFLLILKFKNKRFQVTRTVESLIMIGLCLNLLIGSLFSLLQFLFFTLNVEFPTELWFGNFRYVSPISLIIIFGISIFVGVGLAKLKQPLLGLRLGEENARNLKINKDQTVSKAWWLSFLSVGVVTIFFGVFSFVGLIFPHLLRRFSYFRKNLWAELTLGTLLSGLVFMLLDVTCREVLFFSAEIPVGMVSSILGSGLLMYFLLGKKDSEYSSN